MDQLAQLKRLLFKEEQASLSRLQDRVERPTTRAQDVAEVLAESFVLNDQHDNRLVDAMRPSVEQCITESVRRDPQNFADALFPVIGPAIRKAVAESIAVLAERINQALDSAFSVRGLRWRLESMRTGVPMSEIVLRETLVYRVEQVFVIQPDSGLLIAHAARDLQDSRDTDAVSAMLTAIQDFVRDSFDTSEQTELDSINVGGQTVWLFYGPGAMLAGAIRGHPPSELRETFQRTNEEIHGRFAAQLDDFNGDRSAISGLEEIIQPLIDVEIRRDTTERRERPYLPLAILTGLIIAVLVSLIYLDFRRDRNTQSLIDRLDEIPGIEVFGHVADGGKLTIRALRDPLANVPESLVSDAGFEASAVIFDFAPFNSLEPDIVLRRVRNMLRPPASVDLEFNDGVLSISGRARQEWRETAEKFPTRFAGVDAVNLSQLSISADAVLQAVRDSFQVPDSVKLELIGERVHGRGSASLQWLNALEDKPVDVQSVSAVDFAEVAVDPGSVEAYLKSTLSMPETTTIRVDGRRLVLTGEASRSWFLELQSWLESQQTLSGITAEELKFSEDRELAALVKANETFEVFYIRGTERTIASRDSIRIFSADLVRMLQLDERSNSVGLRFSVSGFTDGAGTAARNEILRDKRSADLVTLLLDNGVDRGAISVIDAPVSGGGRELELRKARLTITLTTIDDGQ